MLKFTILKSLKDNDYPIAPKNICKDFTHNAIGMALQLTKSVI